MEFDAGVIPKMIKLKREEEPAPESEESMLLNESLHPLMNADEIPEIEPMLLPSTTKQDFSIYNDSSHFERRNSS